MKDILQQAMFDERCGNLVLAIQKYTRVNRKSPDRCQAKFAKNRITLCQRRLEEMEA